MGEIKSTLELVMEKAKKIDISQEEKEGFKREEYLSKAKGMVNRYLNGNLNITGLMKELDSYDGKARKIITESVISELVDTVALSLDNERSLEMIGRILQADKFKPLSDSINALYRDFNDKQEKEKGKIEDEIRKSLRGMGIFGSAVQPIVSHDQRWHQTLASLTSKYEARLAKLKEELSGLTSSPSLTYM